MLLIGLGMILTTIPNPISYGQTFIIIKAQFHTHTTYSDGERTPAEIVQMYYKAGYRCIAITDHGTIAGVEEAKREAAKLGMIVIGGQEITSTFPKTTYQYHEDKHIIALFITSRIVRNDLWLTNRVSEYFTMIHAQNGIGIVGHCWNTYTSTPIEQWAWYPYKDASFIDGWEIHGDGRSLNTGEIQYLLNRNYICLQSDDFHRGTIDTTEYNLLYCLNKTEAGIKDALLNRRVIACVQGYIYGTAQALDLYRNNR